MSITFPPQTNGQAADAGFINSVAYAVAQHDAALEAMGADVHGTGKYLTTANTKATIAAATDTSVTDYQINSLDVPAGRMVEFVARIRAQSTVAGDIALFRLKQTNASGAVAAEQRLHLPAAGVPFEATLLLPWRSVAGPITWLLTVQRLSGTGTVTVTTGGATMPGIFYVRDVVADTAFTIV